MLRETSGAVRCLLDSVDFVSPKGCITTMTFYEQPLDGLNIDSLVLQGETLYGIYGHSGVMEALIALLAEGKLSLRPLITHVFSFEEAPEVFRTMYEKVETKIKILIDMGCK